MSDEEDVELQQFPEAITDAVNRHPEAENLTHLVWSQLQLGKLMQPFQLPNATGSYTSLAKFIQTEIYLQMEQLRSNIDDKIRMVGFMPKEETASQQPEKHLRIRLPGHVTLRGRTLQLDFSYVTKEPPRGQFTNYVYVLQKAEAGGGMQNICLAYSKQMSKKGAIFIIGIDANDNSFTGGTIYARPLVNCNMWKTHIAAVVALQDAEAILRDSYVTKQLLKGKIEDRDIKHVSVLDAWIKTRIKASDGPNVDKFNMQQQRALALNALTPRGLVCIQGPPGTGKSHLICNALLPQEVTKGKRVLVICNSNVAVDALMLKCSEEVPALNGRMGRTGFKSSVSDIIVNRGLYFEGDVTGTLNQYGDTAGANSNAADLTVQRQISSAQVIYTTIHYASKEKPAGNYWNFDTLVLDEAAQIEDAKLMIVLARCPSLNKMILVGDPKQLQPYVSDSMRKQRFGRSSMERVMDASSDASHVMLETQYRMPPVLRSVVSHLYYQDRLADDESVRENGPNAAEVDLKPLLVVNVTGTSIDFVRKYQSYANEAEADVAKVVYDFFMSSEFGDAVQFGSENLKSKDVCILTPYNRHKDVLRMKIGGIEEDALDSFIGQTYASVKNTPVKRGSDSRSNLYSVTPLRQGQAMYGTPNDVDDDKVATVENIDTVDGFPSQRKVVMISTCVVGKPRRAADPHFINVACSRAQHLLVVVGNFTSGLANNSDWCYVQGQAKKGARTSSTM